MIDVAHPVSLPGQPLDSGALGLSLYLEQVFLPSRPLAENTRRNYHQAVRQFLKFCGRRMPVRSITRAMLNDFQMWNIARGTTGQTAGQWRQNVAAIVLHANPGAFEHNSRTPDATPPPPRRLPAPTAAELAARKRFGGVQEIAEGWEKTTLDDYVEDYLAVRTVTRAYGNEMRYSIGFFSRWLGRQAEFADLNDDTINQWLAVMAKTGVSTQTQANRKRMALTIWRFGYREGVLKHPPRRVKQITNPRRVPRAWTREDVQRLLEVAAIQKGHAKRSRVPRALFWKAFIMVGWDTGLRFGDIMRLTADDIGPDGRVAIIMHKTGFPIVRRLRPETVKAVEAITSPSRPRIFEDALSSRRVQIYFRAIVRVAGLTGGVNKLRKSAATAIRIAGGDASAFLGHRTAALADRHYIDPRLVQESLPLPPSLF